MIKRIEKYLCGINADKYLHFIAGLLIAQITFALFSFFAQTWICAIISFFVSVIAGALKEAFDSKYGVVSWKDFVATAIGGIVGTLLSLFISFSTYLN